MNQNRQVAFVTGGTSGIGAAFAEEFAQQGYDLVIAGRRKEQLSQLASKLRDKHRTNVEVLIADLGSSAGLDAAEECIARQQYLDVLVNNAGFKKTGSYEKIDWSHHEAMLKVHCLALMKLTHRALPKMLDRNRGTIINVSSVGGFMPFPMNSIYSGTKAFIYHFTESLYLELRRTNIRVQVLVPGVTKTDMFARDGDDPEQIYGGRGMMRAMMPQEVVQESISALRRNQHLCIPGTHNRIAIFLERHLPRRLLHKKAVSMLKQVDEPHIRGLEIT